MALMTVRDPFVAKVTQDSIDYITCINSQRTVVTLDWQVAHGEDVHLLILKAKAVAESALKGLHGTVDWEVARVIVAVAGSHVDDCALLVSGASLLQIRTQESSHEGDWEAVDVQ